jgi:hypothetical protein
MGHGLNQSEGSKKIKNLFIPDGKWPAKNAKYLRYSPGDSKVTR